MGDGRHGLKYTCAQRENNTQTSAFSDAPSRDIKCLRFSRLVDIGLLCKPIGLIPSLLLSTSSLLTPLCHCGQRIMHGRKYSYTQIVNNTLTSASSDAPARDIKCLRFSKLVDMGLLSTPVGPIPSLPLASLCFAESGKNKLLHFRA